MSKVAEPSAELSRQDSVDGQSLGNAPNYVLTLTTKDGSVISVVSKDPHMSLMASIQGVSYCVVSHGMDRPCRIGIAG